MNTSLLSVPAAVRNAVPAPHLTDKYVHISTERMIEALVGEGFEVASIKANGGRNAQFARHVVDLRLPGAETFMGVAPRILFGNSHDGSTRAWLAAGAFRFACSNGLVVGFALANDRIRHTGDLARDLIGRAQSLAKNTAPMFEQIDRWSRIDLSAARRSEFARMAAVLRWNDPQRVEPEDLLRVRRPEDDRGDLWTTFNRVQESATRGGIPGISSAGRRVTTRALGEVNAETRFNAQLWQLATEFAEVVG